MQEEKKRLRCLVKGDVQGVGFRWSARERALDLGLTGYVQNLDDGRLEIVAEGSENALEAFKAFCYRGPDGARVADIAISEEPSSGEFQNFEIR